MNVYYLLKHTISITVPVAAMACLIAYSFGYTEISLGLLIGVIGGMGKTFIMTNSVIHGTNPILSFFFKYLTLGGALILGMLVSIQAFFATVVGIFFVNVVFIMDQIKADSTEEIG
jgi:hypothetical protein